MLVRLATLATQTLDWLGGQSDRLPGSTETNALHAWFHGPRNGLLGKLLNGSGSRNRSSYWNKADPFRMMATLNGAKVVMPAVEPERPLVWLLP